MSVLFREARRADVPAVVGLMADDALGAAREALDDMTPYLATFDRMQAEGGNLVIVGDMAGRVVATYQITVIDGLSLKAARRAQLESVRVAAELRGQGIGRQLLEDAEARARAAGCRLIQLTSNATRSRARDFYVGNGYAASHTGFKRTLD